jgi:DNA-binding CsgD family transcriptional regulator
MSRDLNNNNGNRNLKWDKELIDIRKDKVFELSSRGYSQHDIAKILNVSVGLVNSDLKQVYAKARDTFNTYLQEELPKEFQKALSTYDYIIKTAATTAEMTKDDRIKLQALHEVREARTARMDMISNHDVMSYHVNKGKDKESKEQEQPEQSTDSEVSEQNLEGETEEFEEEQDVSKE